jgi:hypothetical protein
MMKSLIVILSVYLIISQTVLAFSGNGSGTEEDPYQITTVEQLQEMNDDLDAHYILMNDIDASETREWNVGDHDNDPETPDSAMGFEPIGFVETKYLNEFEYFTGKLDGQGFQIKGLFINRGRTISSGLFELIGSGCIINDLSIIESEISSSLNCGILAGMILTNYDSNENISISNCILEGDINSIGSKGGLAGYIDSKHVDLIIENCHYTGNIYSNTKWTNGGLSGGLLGYIVGYKGNIEINDCSSFSKIYGIESDIGGFCGKIENSIGDIEIINCKSEFDIYGKKHLVGGFCSSISAYSGNIMIIDCISEGIIHDTIASGGGFCRSNHSATGNSILRNCISYVDILSYDELGTIGGFCGSNGSDSGKAIIEYCVSYGDVTGTDEVGGFCGILYSFGSGECRIEYCASYGDVKGYNEVGGFCGSSSFCRESSNLTIRNCFSTSDVSGKSYIGGFCGRYSMMHYENVAQIENCYSSGNIKLLKDDKYYSIGGFCGGYESQSKVNSCYWDTETSGITKSYGGEGKTTAEMMMQSTFDDWDFDNVWCMVEGKTYPQLQHFVDCDTLVSVLTIESNERLEIYPNPATSQITISLGEEFISTPEIDIIDYLGNVMRWTPSARWSPSDKSITINTSSLSPGVYFLRMRSGDRVEVKKFVVI